MESKDDHADDDVQVPESAKREAEKMMSAYDDRPTAVLPGSHNTVTGTAINDWLDEDGNPKWGRESGADTPSDRRDDAESD